tara:strand:- start:1001 stop:3244 length:2244 start_codon:yes stop_codon:yes gene_type:complete
MVLPFIAAAATGFLEEGVKQKDLYDKRQFELEKQRQASKLRKQEQRELYDYKASLEKAKLDAEKAGFNKELFGVSYNTQGMTNFNDKAIAAVNAVSSDPTSAISYLGNLKRSGNNQLYQQQLAEFKNAYQIAQMTSAKLAGKQMGVVGIPDMARQYSGLTQFLSASEIPEVGNYLREANQSFAAFQQAAVNEKNKQLVLNSFSPQTPTNAKELIAKRLDAGETMTGDKAQQLATAYSERLKTPRPPSGQQVDPAQANATLADYYIKNPNNWTSSDLQKTGYHWRVGFTQGLRQKRTINGYGISKRENAKAYDESLNLFIPNYPEVNQGQYGFVNVKRLQQKDFQELVNKPAVRKEIEQKKALYKTMRDINEPLLELMDAIDSEEDMVGVSGFTQRIFDGISGQVDGMLNVLGRTQPNMSDTLRAKRQELADSLKKDRAIVNQYRSKEKLSKPERLALINSVGNLAAFLLARYAQKDDNKISNDDVKNMKKSIGLDEMITSLDQVESKLSYYIDKSQRDMLELEGYSPQRNPTGNRRAFEHARLWEAMMSSTRGINPNTGNRVMSVEERVREDRTQTTTTRFTDMIGAVPRGAKLADIRNQQIANMLRSIDKKIGRRLEYEVQEGQPEGAIRQELGLTQQLRNAFASKSRLRENFYVSSVKVTNEPDKYVVFDLARSSQDGKSRPDLIIAAESMEEVYRQLSEKTKTKLTFTTTAGAPSTNGGSNRSENTVSRNKSARLKARENRGKQ